MLRKKLASGRQPAARSNLEADGAVARCGGAVLVQLLAEFPKI
jgi:hypothetical protein